MPTVRRMSASVPLVTGMPPMSMLPCSGVSSPLRCRRSVDLPAPLAPTTAIASPWPISNETPSSACVPSGYAKLEVADADGVVAHAPLPSLMRTVR